MLECEWRREEERRDYKVKRRGRRRGGSSHVGRWTIHTWAGETASIWKYTDGEVARTAVRKAE